MVTGKPGESSEQIMMIPETANTHNMQQLNEIKTNNKSGIKNLGGPIDFYQNSNQQRIHTVNSNDDAMSYNPVEV